MSNKPLISDEVLGFLAMVVFFVVIPLFVFWLGNTDTNTQSKPYSPTSSSDSETIIQDGEYSSSEYEEENEDSEPLEFGGYECLDDCSGHEAGYDWAESNDVCDEYFDEGNSESFNEGVRVYAEEGC